MDVDMEMDDLGSGSKVTLVGSKLILDQGLPHRSVLL